MVSVEELRSMLEAHAVSHTNVEIPPGWRDLVAECHKQLLQIYPEYKLSQVKEKFGGLRYYVGPIPKDLATQFYATVGEFEDKSYQICQVCGEPGHLQLIGTWYYTLCQVHGDETSEWRKNRWA